MGRHGDCVQRRDVGRGAKGSEARRTPTCLRGSRTYHRLASAVEDAGFEIRDQIMWLYGSGFPKSHNVSKGIDKSDAVETRRQRNLKFTEWMRSTGITAKQIDKITGTFMGHHYTTHPTQPAIATGEMFDKLRALLPQVPEWVEQMVAERTIESENFKKREVVGTKFSGIANKEEGQRHTIGASKAVEVDITVSSTPAAKQWDGWGTALKPAHEPIVVARKPLIGTVANNVLTYGTGALNIDGSRVGGEGGTKLISTENDKALFSPGTGELTRGYGEVVDGLGRWPANVIHDGSDEVLAGFPNTKSGGLNGRSVYSEVSTQTSSSFIRGMSGKTRNYVSDPNEGSASRFFYCAKASKSERNAGLEGFEPKRESDRPSDDKPGGDNLRNRTNTASQNFHPTVKPIALMRYLVKLVTPPNGTVLDPFLGSGTTAVAAILEGFNWMGCEMTEDYWPIIEARVKWAELQPKTLL